jgi:hypothetical protein
VTGDVDWRGKRAGLYWAKWELGRSCAAARSGSLERGEMIVTMRCDWPIREYVGEVS